MGVCVSNRLCESVSLTTRLNVFPRWRLVSMILDRFWLRTVESSWTVNVVLWSRRVWLPSK